MGIQGLGFRDLVLQVHGTSGGSAYRPWKSVADRHWVI